MTRTWAAAVGHTETASAAAMAIVARSRSGASVRAMPQTAWATTATAASLRPWSQPAPERSSPRTPSPNSTMATADGRVKPSQAATPPASPARTMPMAMLT